MKIRYKGYVARQKRNNTVIILWGDLIVEEILCNERLSAKELRTLINKHIKAKVCKEGETGGGKRDTQ